MNTKTVLLQLFQEFIWWGITAAICVAVLYPITSKMDYQYVVLNSFFIVIGITSLRYFLFFNSLFFLQNVWVRFGIFVTNLILWMVVINKYESMFQVLDIFDTSQLGKPLVFLSISAQTELMKYIYQEILLSGLCALIGLVFLNLRIVGSYWRVAKIRFTARMQ
ncbi:MAG: hypothetical protein M9931_04250 [Chitinophagales bacterium]|nr:hypothetical protein [Chitinophagales bacterium]MCO5280255.1 hypothetical protein [Chitinophagales bacterium]OJV26414.1 MAG: hypothetical protein BGO32_12470 [Bacteroidetes bacterium 37-13]HRN94914.1 hypothetical protein [Chitinophagales bacterium]HRP39424.1 hypothetical protein [Chitinophagales bacterium]